MKTTILLGLLFLFTISVYGQIDTAFWFVVPDLSSDHGDDTEASFRFAALGDDIKIYVTMPALNKTLFTTTIAAGEFKEMALDAILFNNGYVDDNYLESGLPYKEGIVDNRGVYIYSECVNPTETDKSFTVYLDRYIFSNRDIWTLKGNNALGQKFTIPRRNKWVNSDKYMEVYSAFDIVATENNTTVTIESPVSLQKSNGSVWPANQKITIVLNKGETFSGVSIDGSTANHVGGTVINANKKIAVSYKDDSVNADTGNDSMGDQLVNDDLAGEEFIVTTAGLYFETVFLTSVLDGITTITYNGNTYQIPNKGGVIDIPMSADANYIRSDKPIHVFQATGRGDQIGGALVPPIVCTGSRSVTVYRTESSFFFINLITRKENINSFSLYVNGIDIGLRSTAFAPVPGKSDWYFLKYNNFSTDTMADYYGRVIPEYSTIKVVNSNMLPSGDGLFHLEVVEGTDWGSKAGYFSSFGVGSVNATIGLNFNKHEDYCEGDTILLNASGSADLYIWNYNPVGAETATFLNGNNIVNPKVIVSGNAPFTAGFTVSMEDNCFAGVVQSSVTFDMHKNPEVTIPNVEICEGETASVYSQITGGSGVYNQFVWYGEENILNNYSAKNPNIVSTTDAGNYFFRFKVTDNFGCDGRATTNVLIRELPVVELEQDGLLCSKIPTGRILAHIIPPPFDVSNTTGSFELQDGLSADGIVTYVDFPDDTIVAYNHTDEYGCTGRAELYVTVVDTILMNLDDPLSICEGAEYLSVDAGPYSTFLWNTGATSQILTIFQEGEYSVYVEQNKCSGRDTVHVFALDPTYPDVQLSASNLCSRQATSFNVQFFEQGDSPVINWYLNNRSIDPLSKQFDNYETFGFPDNSVLRVDMRTSLVCPVDSVVSGYIYFNNSPLIQVDFDSFACLGANDSLEIFIENIYETSGYSDVDAIIGLEKKTENQYYFFPDSTIGVTGGDKHLNISWTADNGCSSDTAVSIFIGGVSSDIIGNIRECTNTYESNYYIDNDSINSVQWSVTGGKIFYSLTGNSDKIIYIDWIEQGIEKVSATILDIFGCTSYASKTVSVSPPPEANFMYTTYYDKQKAIFINESTQDSIYGKDTAYLPLVNYRWFFTDTSRAIEQLHTDYDSIFKRYYTYGFYNIKLVAVNDHNCKDSITQILFMDQYSGLYIPNALSPYDDAIEVREFRPVGVALKEYKIWIYDKWGNLVWFSDALTKEGAPAEAWDGRYDGEIMQQGAYVWKIEATMVNGQPWKGKETSRGKFKTLGSVYLIR